MSTKKRRASGKPKQAAIVRFRGRPVKPVAKPFAKREHRPPGLRVDITELKQREASFRLLFDSNPVPMIVCALGDERILAVNDAAIQHYGYSRSEFEKLTIRSLRPSTPDCHGPATNALRPPGSTSAPTAR